MADYYYWLPSDMIHYVGQNFFLWLLLLFSNVVMHIYGSLFHYNAISIYFCIAHNFPFKNINNFDNIFKFAILQNFSYVYFPLRRQMNSEVSGFYNFHYKLFFGFSVYDCIHHSLASFSDFFTIAIII